jgi:PTS system nitrogen regulatory IIA component
VNLTVKDAARLLGVSDKTIYRWIRQDIMPCLRIGATYRFNRAELLAWATSRRMGLATAALTEPESDSLPLPTLADCLETGGVFYRIEGRTRHEVLADVVAHLRLPEELDRTVLTHALIARENLASTGIGDGIAVPHIHNPGLLTVTRPTVTLCYLENAVDFRALDLMPVRILFTLLSPTLRAQLHLQAQLMFALKQPLFRQAVLAEESRELIHAALRQPHESVVR